MSLQEVLQISLCLKYARVEFKEIIMLELRLWQFGTDDPSIPSFLEGMKVAHNEPIRKEDWFHWKFEQSPYGKAIMACAFDGNKVAGCVAYGRGIVRFKDKEWKCALSYENFVHPDYQGKGLFKKLISLAEKEMKEAGIQFLYNFPNANSITGFKHMNWICRNDIKSFKIKPLRILRVLHHIKSLKHSFSPNLSNLEEIRDISLDNIVIEQTIPDIITPIWTKEYLKWRFFTYPNREYFIVNNQDFFSISMVGMRGRLKVVRHLYSLSRKGRPLYEIMNQIISEVKNKTQADIFEYSSTIYDDSLRMCHGFITFPSHGNFCFKVIDEEMEIDNFKIKLPSINAHTY